MIEGRFDLGTERVEFGQFLGDHRDVVRAVEGQAFGPIDPFGDGVVENVVGRRQQLGERGPEVALQLVATLRPGIDEVEGRRNSVSFGLPLLPPGVGRRP